MLLSHLPRVQLVHAPTPLEFLPNLTKALNGPQIYIKRDDATGLATGGNKTRKLEFLIGDALAKDATHVLTKVQLNLTMFAKRLQQPINLA